MPASRRELLLGSAALLALGTAPALSAPRDDADEALIARMTPEEKAGQLTLLADATRPLYAPINPEDGKRAAADLLDTIRAGRCGALFNGVGAAGSRAIQKVAVEESRLGIPMLFAADVVHGYDTIFPVPLGEAASFEPALAERTARAAAIEASAAGVHQTYAPMVDIARDERWGRVVEGAGEDVLLSSRFAAARVRGFQGARGLTAIDALMATPKHFAGYGAVQGGMEYNTVDISAQTLWDVHLPPFEAAIAAGARSIMAAFVDLNGVPATANRELLTTILRDRLGFTGFVVTDYTADRELIDHGVAADEPDAARLALLAGVDMSMESGIFRFLPDLVRQGRVPQARLDEAVRRVLGAKRELGLFDDPYKGMDPVREKVVMGRPATRLLARDAARRSIVMLRNEGGLLPIDPAARIALIGPFGEDKTSLFGSWAPFSKSAESCPTIAEALRARMGGPERLAIETGSKIAEPLDGGIDRAVAAARGADVVLLAIGEAEDMSGEAQSRTEIVVPAAQMALADAVAATGKPIVVLLKNGRALALEGAVRDARAILVTWFLGSETGSAIADILFGDHAPSGRLPVSFPVQSGQEPFTYDRRSTGRPQTEPTVSRFKARYRETANVPLYAFGHGLTYSEIGYEALTIDPTMAWGGEIAIGATIVNRGRREAEEVVQLYIHDRVASRTRPIRLLRGFEKVRLAAGAARPVRFALTMADLTFAGPDLRPTVEPGLFDIWVAPSAEAPGLKGSFTLLAQASGPPASSSPRP